MKPFHAWNETHRDHRREYERRYSDSDEVQSVASVSELDRLRKLVRR